MDGFELDLPEDEPRKGLLDLEELQDFDVDSCLGAERIFCSIAANFSCSWSSAFFVSQWPP